MNRGWFAQWRRWYSRRGGAHRAGSMRTGVSPELSAELDRARRKLADVNALAPKVDAAQQRAQRWLRDNHLGPMFDDAFGLRTRPGNGRG